MQRVSRLIAVLGCMLSLVLGLGAVAPCFALADEVAGRELMCESGRVELIQEGAFPHAVSLPTGEGELTAQSEADYEGALARLAEGMRNLEEEIVIQEYAIPLDEWWTVYENAVNFNPDIWYVESGAQVYHYSGADTAYCIVPSYIADAETIEPMKAGFEAALDDLLSWVPRDASQEQQVKAVHDWLVKNCVYNIDAANQAGSFVATPENNPHSAYGALVSKNAVCQGYSLAFGVAMKELGIPYAYAYDFDETHMWNRVQVDGSWYHVDVTWDDPIINGSDAGFSYTPSTEYFLKSDEGLRAVDSDDEIHANWHPEQPSCTDTRYDNVPNSSWAVYSAPSTNPHTRPHSIALAEIEPIAELTYTGEALEPPLTIRFGDNVLVADTDYSAAYENNVNVGEATVTITGMGSYTGTTTVAFTIVRGEQTIDASDLTLVYGDVKPLGARTNGDGTLSYQSSDGNVATVNSRGQVWVNGVGTTTVTIRAAQTSNWNAAQKTVTVTVNPYDIANGRADVMPRTFTYSGTACEPRPTVVVTFDTGMRTISTESLDVTYANNVDAGRAVATMTGKGNFTGTATSSFTINKASQAIEAQDIKLTFGSEPVAIGATVTGVGDEAGALSYAIKDESVARVSEDGKVEPVAHGETTLTITAAATKNLNGATTEVTVTVTPKALEGLVVDVVEPRPDYLVYDGTPKEPDVCVAYGDELVPEEDYSVKFENNVDAGEATVTVTLTGDFEGVGYGSFVIAQAPQAIQITNDEVLAMTYGGKATLEVAAVGDLTFASSDASVLVVSDKGEIEAIGVGEATLTITTPGTKNYAAAMLNAVAHVLPMDIGEAEVTVEPDEFTYDGTAKKPQVMVAVNGNVLSDDSFDIAYENNVDAGQAKATATGKGNYTGTVTKSFTIGKASQTIEAQDIKLPFGSAAVAIGATVTGVGNEAGTLSYAVKDESVVRVSEDGKLEPVALGETTLTITAAATKNLAEETAEVIVSVVPKALEDLRVDIVESRPDYLVYDGTPKEPEVAVLYGDQPLTAHDYVVEYADNVDAGEATVYVTLVGNYEGSCATQFVIAQAPQAIQITNDEVLAMTYGGKATLEVAAVGDLTFASSDTSIFTVNDKGEIEAVGTGQAELTVTASGNENYAKAELGAVVRVAAIDITAAEVTVDPDTFTYDGTAKEPQVSVKLGDVVVPLESLDVTYAANTNAGEARVEVTAKSDSNYTGDAMKTFTIVKAQQTIGISCPEALTLDVGHTAEIGAVAESQETGSVTGLALTYASSDESVATVGESGLITAVGKGLATITVSTAGDDNHEPASRSIALTVADTNIAHAAISVSTKDFTYNGSAQKPEVTVVLDGVTLVEGVDYQLTIINNINAGQASLTVKGIGQYEGLQLMEQAFTIAKAAPVITTSKTEFVIGKKAKLGALVSKGAGKLTYKSSKPSVATVSGTGQVKGLKAGKAKITITSAESANYLAGKKTVTIKVGKANPMAVKAKAGKVTAAYKTVAKKAVVLANNVKFTKKAQGKVTYANASTNATAKTFKVAAKTGKVTVPKGTPKGTYTVKLKVKAKGNSAYISGTKTVSFKVVVK